MNDKDDFSRFQKFLPKTVGKLATDIGNAGGQCIIVGGWIRDRLLQIPTSQDMDVDMEVFKISYEKLYQICSNYEIVASYPKFGIIRLKNIDLSLPRTETLLGQKYNDFQVTLDPNLTFSQATCRRDFSVNAIGWNFLTNEIFDPFNGINATNEKCLIPLTEHFKEDSYRVLRAVQLIARFNFKPSDKLIHLAQQMNPYVISPRHIEETQAILHASNHKKPAFDFLKTLGHTWENLFEI